MWKDEDADAARHSIISTVSTAISNADSGAREWITSISEHITYANQKFS